jgi:LiaF transmembrane domain
MKKKLIVPIFTILVGITWLLNVMGIMPSIDWMWTLGLAIAGVLCIVIGGLNKRTVVTGPFLIVASICSLLRQTEILRSDYEIPVLVIAFGLLMLISQLPRFNTPEALQEK